MKTFLIVSIIWIVVLACYDRFQTRRVNELERKIAKYERMLYHRISEESNNKNRNTKERDAKFRAV